jgi:iron complex outermembrane receptor protein
MNRAGGEVTMTMRGHMFAAAALVGAIWCAPAWAQPGDGTIRGVVRDTTGAAIAGATVTAANQATGASETTESANDGTYSLTVPPGSYDVSASIAGFRAGTQTVTVTRGQSSTLEFTLQPLLTEEITVTSMKREQAVLEVPFSVAAPTEDVLRSRGVQDIEGVAANVGGFTVQNLGPGQSQVAMRGVSAGQIVRDQPGVKEQVGTYLDESVISLSLFTPDIDLVDVNRVEVLRGPQGTLFGSGSLSGTVRYITNQPELGVFNGSVELGASTVGGGGAGGNAKLVLNAPLGERAALRIASYFGRLPGYIDAVQPDLSVNEDVNDGMRSGARVTVKLEPNSSLSITPRFFYQKVEMDGWNRVDAYNILANAFTTTRPAVTLGEREQFTQLEEEFTDDFLLADLDLTYDFGDLALSSITSYVYRDVLVVRDATALTGSITGGSLGLPEPVYTLDGPLHDATTATTWAQELRLASDAGRFPWVAGMFFSRQDRDYGQTLPVTGFEDMTGIPTAGLRAPKDVLFFSDLDYQLSQFALFGETTVSVSENVDVIVGLRFYHFSEDKEQIFDGLFGNDNTGSSLVSQPGSTDASGLAPRIIASYKFSADANLNAQFSRGFRLGGINDPLNVPLCTPQDLVTFGGRETWEDETVWNYEVGYKTRVMNGLGTFNVAAFYMDVSDLQATLTAGSCSSRVVFNVPNARSQGVEIEFEAAPTRNFDFAVSTSFTDGEMRSTLTSTGSTGAVTVIPGVEEGLRLPTAPQFQFAGAATYQWEVRPGSLAYVTGTYQHIGSRFTQVGDEVLGTLDLTSFGANTIGGPLTATTFTYDPELPGYDLLHARIGVRRAEWDLSVFVNNVTDERALLAFDQERGTRARISYLTNQPRTFGVNWRFNF